MRLDALPPRMAVIGGGFVACEMAHVFAALGVAVTQVQRGEALLRHHEVEVSQRYTEIARHRYDVRLSTTPTSAERIGDVWRIGLTGPGGASHVEAEVVLLAVGRVPNTDRLEPAAAGLEVHDDGRLVVDDQLRATAPGVWALGDVSSAHQLKHVANHEARIVAHNLAVDLGRLDAPPRTTDARAGPPRRVRPPAGRRLRADRCRARPPPERRSSPPPRPSATSPTAGRWRTPPACSPSTPTRPAGSSPRTPSGRTRRPSSSRSCRPRRSGSGRSTSPAASTGSTRPSPRSSRTPCSACRCPTPPEAPAVGMPVSPAARSGCGR